MGSTQLTLEDLPFDDIPDVVVSALSGRQLVTYLCQRRAVLSLQCTCDSAVSIECLLPLRTMMTPYTMLQEYVIVCKASDSTNPLTVLQMASIHDCLLDNDCERLRDACSRPVSRENWYAGHFLPNPSNVASTPCQCRLQEDPGHGQLKIEGFTRCVSMRRVSTLCSPLIPLNPWQHAPPYPRRLSLIFRITPLAKS